MPISDFLHLDELAFAHQISLLPDADLLKLDIHHCRAIHGGTFGAAIGAVEAPLTAGISLVGSAIGLRRRNVAKRKLEIVRAELERRGLPVHEQTKRDWMIPLAVTGLGMGVAGGVMEGVMGAIPVDSLADAGITLATNTTAQMATEAAGKLGVEAGSDKILEKGLPGTGRSKVWKQKLSRSVSQLQVPATTLQVPESSPAAISAPSSPMLMPEGNSVGGGGVVTRKPVGGW